MALRSSHDLPMLPGARARAMLLLHNPDATIQDFVQVFAADPALAVAALAAANSAASAPVRPIATVREAVVRIGAQQARHIAVSSLMRSQFDARLQESWIEVGAFWEHCVVTGLLTEYLVGMRPAPGVSFTAGFLHDLGRLALVSENPFRYRQVIDLAKAGASVGAAERRIFGATHLATGERLATRWGLPQEIVSATAHHHEREGSPMGLAVFHARRLGWKLGYGDGVLSPDTVELDEETEGVLRHFDGEQGLHARVRWYALAAGGEHPSTAPAADSRS
jgi:HD-like signal output (HDOD) protein